MRKTSQKSPKGSTGRHKAPSMATSPIHNNKVYVSTKNGVKYLSGWTKSQSPMVLYPTPVILRASHLNIALRCEIPGFQTLRTSFTSITHLEPATSLARDAFAPRIGLHVRRIYPKSERICHNMIREQSPIKIIEKYQNS